MARHAGGDRAEQSSEDLGGLDELAELVGLADLDGFGLAAVDAPVPSVPRSTEGPRVAARRDAALRVTTSLRDPDVSGADRAVPDGAVPVIEPVPDDTSASQVTIDEVDPEVAALARMFGKHRPVAPERGDEGDAVADLARFFAEPPADLPGPAPTAPPTGYPSARSSAERSGRRFRRGRSS